MKVKAAINKLMALAGCGLLATGIGCKPLDLDNLTKPSNEIVHVESEEQVEVQAFLLIPEGFDEDLTERINRINQLIRESQTIFANEMERHGYGRKTFTIDEGQDGKIKVTILTGVIEDYGWSNAPHRPHHLYHQHVNVLFSVDYLDKPAWGAHLGYGPSSPYVYGSVVIGEGSWLTWTVVHELGHAFGLSHDYKNDEIDPSYFMGYNFSAFDETKLSDEMAYQLNNHEAFNNLLYDEVPSDFYGIWWPKSAVFNSNILEIKVEAEYISPYQSYLDQYNMAIIETRDVNYHQAQPQELSFTRDIQKEIIGNKIVYTIRFDTDSDYLKSLGGFILIMKGPFIPIVDHLGIDFHLL